MTVGNQLAERTLVRLMLLTTFGTGIIDAIGYLGFDRVFTANMTGNVIILGMGLAGVDGLPVIGPLIALLAFSAGAACAGAVVRPEPDLLGRRTCGVLTAEAVVLGALGTALLVHPVRAGTPYGYAMTAALALVLGAQAAAARHVGVKDVTTVVVTSTLTGWAADSRLVGGPGTRARRRGSAVLAILMGAIVGGLLHRVDDGYGVLATALVMAAVTAFAWRSGRNEQRI